MDEKQLKEIQEKIQKGINDGLEALKKEVGTEAESRKAEVKALEAQLKDVNEKLAKIEAAPAKGVAPAIVRSQKFLGLKISKQMQPQRQHIANKPGDFDVLRSEEAQDELAKYFIAASRALVRNPEPEAVKYLYDINAKAALAEGATTTGGFLVPTEYQWDMLMLSRDVTFALKECNVIQMGTNDMRVPTEAMQSSVVWTAEGVAATETEPTVGQVALTAKRLDAYAISSNELLADSYYDIAGLLAGQFSYGIALELDNQVLNGDGTKLGSGVLTAAAGYSVVQTGAGSQAFSSISADSLSLAAQSVDEMYGAGGKFIYNKLIQHYIRTLKDTQGRFVYAMPGNGVPGTIWEYPYILSSKGPKTTATATAFVAFGNFKYYVLGVRAGSMMLESDPYGLFTASQTRFRMVSRWAGKIGQANAFCRIMTA